MVLSKFWWRILYIAFNRDTFVFLNENLGHLTLIFLKTTPKLPFGRWYFPTIFRDFCHLCWTILNDFDVSPTRKNVSMFVNILRSHLAYLSHIINTKLKNSWPFSTRVRFGFEMRKNEINRACAFHSFIKYFKIQTQLTNWCCLSLLFHQPNLVHPRQTSTSRWRLYFCRSHPGAFQNVTIEKLALSCFKITVQSKFCGIW